MKTPDEIIEAVGGPQRVRDALRVSQAALRKWRQFGAVPARHQVALLRLSAGRLTLDDFHDPASKTASEAA